MMHSNQNPCCKTDWHYFLLALLLLGNYLVFLEPLSADEELPVLGENAIFNIEQEVEIGEKVYQQLLSKGLVETHPLLDQFINELGARLLAVVEHRARQYRFFIVRDGSINAFALPGGYIGVNIGLILRAQTQDQLASVLAHEISHVRLRHGLKLMEKSEGVSNATLLTMLAGLLIGGGTDLGAALVYGGAAGGRQTMINYTRDFEYEADRLGITLLQGAEFDGRGMVEFFQLLGKISGNSESQNIEYLRTHPVSANRISEVEARLDPPSSKSPAPDYFTIFKDYLLYSNSENFSPAGSKFREALSKIKSGDESSANELLKALYTQNSDNIWYGFSYAENLEFLGRQVEAEEVYRQLLRIYPNDFIVSLSLMRVLKKADRFDDALLIARRLEVGYPLKKAVFFELVEIYQQLNESLLKMMAQAEYHWLVGSPKLAIKLYRQILTLPDIDLATESKAREKLAELEH
ncbi:MAG: M48 family metalloprotease [Gammaproteobacteria bacterium]|nr:M48 family metalloprotease [Gammaproteobacteria bacterium]